MSVDFYTSSDRSSRLGPDQIRAAQLQVTNWCLDLGSEDETKTAAIELLDCLGIRRKVQDPEPRTACRGCRKPLTASTRRDGCCTPQCAARVRALDPTPMRKLNPSQSGRSGSW